MSAIPRWAARTAVLTVVVATLGLGTDLVGAGTGPQRSTTPGTAGHRDAEPPVADGPGKPDDEAPRGRPER
ncbi:hypothetical protein, partial [Streptomyces sp. TR06-5]